MKRKRILLVDPPTRSPQTLNIGLGWLAANLTDVCEDVCVLGLANIPCIPTQAEKLLHSKVASFRPDIIGFNIHCTTYRLVLSLIKTLRQSFSGTIVVGGPHVSYERSRILAEGPEIDVVVMGEAEHSFAQFCKRESGDYEGIGGLLYRTPTAVVENPITTVRKEFGSLRHPDYRQFGIKKLFSSYPISTSRGCPFNCSFCNPFMGGKHWRPRSFEDVFEELAFAKRIFGIREFVVVEPVFNFQEDHVIEFCRRLRKQKLNLPWYSSSGLRADHISPAMIEAMKQSGCTHIKIGVESLIPEVFKDIRKGETLEEIREAVRIIKRGKIPLRGSFIIGLPHDTLERARKNYELSRELDFDATDWSLLFPYPGTRAYDWMQQHGTIRHSIETAHQVPTDLGDQDFRKPITVHIACETPDFSRKEREMAFWEINTQSGNYAFPLLGPDWLKAKVIAQAIWRYDRRRLFWHARHLLRLLYRRWKSQSKEGTWVEFQSDAFA